MFFLWAPQKISHSGLLATARDGSGICLVGKHLKKRKVYALYSFHL
jgi:hypothetical protein